MALPDGARPELWQSNVSAGAQGVKLRNTLQVRWSQRAKWRPMRLMFDSLFYRPMTFSKATQLTFHARSLFAQAWALTLAVSAAAALFAMVGSAHAQSAQPSAPADAASAAKAPAVAPRYAASDLERAFDFMDDNHDGKVSREEASGFRGVAKHFEQADTDRDGFLSRVEFDTAMNYVKPQ